MQQKGEQEEEEEGEVSARRKEEGGGVEGGGYLIFRIPQYLSRFCPLLLFSRYLKKKGEEGETVLMISRQPKDRQQPPLVLSPPLVLCVVVLEVVV